MNALARLSLASLFVAPLFAAEPPTPGHSMHGEAFNEGPRQFATLIPGATSVHFPITSKHAEAQKFFDQGVTQLHGFWYFEAERSFRQVAYLDPDCAMAYWGVMMANVNNEKRAAEFAKEAAKRRAQASPREQRWIDMWAAYYADTKKDEKVRRGDLVNAYEEYIYAFPDDLEAKAFLVLQLWDNRQHSVPLGSRAAVEALAQQVLTREPMHPGIHHYLIHLWNRGGSDKHAVFSAARCGQSAPAIAHLWHMSGHTFSELHRYPEACWQQEASARVDHQLMAATRIMPEQIHNYAHNNDWLVKNLGYVGRIRDAIDLAKNLVELPRLGPDKQAAYRMGRERLLEIGVTFELWDQLTALESTPFLAPDADAARETERLRALGIAWFSKGDKTRGEEKLAALAKQLAEAKDEAAKTEAKLKTGEKPKDDAAKPAKPDAPKTGKTDYANAKDKPAEKKPAGRVDAIEKAMAEVRLNRALAAGELDTVRTELAKANDLPSARQARIQLALGDTAKAEQLARDLIKADAGQFLPYAILAHALDRAGKADEALKVFQQLRARSADIDIDLPAITRLAPFAEKLQLPRDWRAPAVIPTDIGVRPEIATLGPFRWQPYEAPDFSLPDSQQQPVSLAAHRGRPVLVVFYLGAGCSHCIQQLNTFAPLAADYTAAGIDIVAISTDTPSGLQRTFDQAKDGKGFPFQIVSDHELTAFHAYRAFDDFEGMPLHGTFLIDATGRVRWQNISYQPFTEAKWLLEESKRLLATPLLPTVAVVK